MSTPRMTPQSSNTTPVLSHCALLVLLPPTCAPLQLQKSIMTDQTLKTKHFLKSLVFWNEEQQSGGKN